jgi:hypothetical protein
MFTTLRNLVLRKNILDIACHKTVGTYADWVQCAAVRTHCVEIRLPPQKDEPPIKTEAWNGLWPSTAGVPPIIFDGGFTGAPSEIQMNQLLTISLTTTFT